MGGFFGAVSRRDVVLDVFFGTDYHSHLGTRNAGMAIWSPEHGCQRQIHSISNTPFRTKFEKDLADFKGGCCGIGCISDSDPQPLLVRSHLGLYAITTVGQINNAEQLVDTYFSDHGHQFMAMSSGKVNCTELVAALINERDSLVEGIQHMQRVIDGSMTVLLMTAKGEIIAARDKVGRLPILVGKDQDGFCVSFESFAFQKLGYTKEYELGPAEIVRITADRIEPLAPAASRMKICAFLWSYYGYPNSKTASEGRLCGRRSRLRHSTCNRICKPQWEAFCQALCQVYSHLAALLHAGQPGCPRPGREDEADPGSRAD